jgi:predicted metal-binding membrane protein
MMTPLVIGEVRATANRSLWRRRERAISGFLTGFLGAWFLVGLFIATLASTLEIAGWWNFQWLGALGFAGAAGWQLTSRKKRALWSCHRTMPLSPDGWRADVDCIRYGWDIGQTCVASCWAMMLACALTAHGLIAMLCVGTLAGVERYGVRPRFSSVAVSLTGLALVYATLGLSGGQAL